VAANAHGSSYFTFDLDICYARDAANMARLAVCFAPLHPQLRGAPAGLPFLWDAETLARGLNFTLTTDLGDVDLLGEVSGVGGYPEALRASCAIVLYGVECHVLSLEALVRAKRAAGRPKDLQVATELEAIREALEPDGD
jgi:hypothetical protein